MGNFACKRGIKDSYQGCGALIDSLQAAREARDMAKERARQLASLPLTDSERINVLVESMKLGYQAFIEIFDRLDKLEKERAEKVSEC